MNSIFKCPVKIKSSFFRYHQYRDLVVLGIKKFLTATIKLLAPDLRIH